MFFSLMQLLGLIVFMNLANVHGCRFDMEFNERVRVCSQCKNKEVVGKQPKKLFQYYFTAQGMICYISARRTPWAQALFRETCFQLRRGGCCATQHFQNIYNQACFL